MFEPESFRLIGADFLGLGTSQLLLAVLNTQSNGMGVEYWSVWVITPDIVSAPLPLNDFGVMSFLTSAPGGKCKVFAATWRPGWEPKRGHGLYIVGQWHEMSLFDISVDWDRPALYRRYLFDLERQRNRALGDTPRQSIPWHTSEAVKPIIGPYPMQ